MNNFYPFKTMGFLALGFFALFTLLGSYAIVTPGHRGILVTLGKPSATVLAEGFHAKLPYVSHLVTFSTRVRKSEASSEAATRDMQLVHATFALNWAINPDSVSVIYSNIGTESDIETRIINPAVSEVLKTAAAQMTAEEILTKRLQLKETIDHLLIERLTRYNIIVKDISLVNFSFTKEFNEAVERKQIAEQEAKQAMYTADKAKQDAVAAVNAAKGQAESMLVKARAQAESQKLLQSTLSPQILQMEYLKRWDGSLPQVLGNGSNLLFNINGSTKGKE